MSEHSEDESKRRNGPVPVASALASSLARMAEARKANPTLTPAPAVPTVRLVSSNLTPAEPTITRGELAEILEPLEIIYPGRAMEAGDVADKYEIYFQTLKHLTRRKIAMAAERYVRNTTPVFDFYPKPAHLLDFAKDRF